MDSKATDPYSGGGFRLELEKAIGATPNSKLGGRALFFQLLKEEELEALLAHQNKLIASLPSPPTDHVQKYPQLVQQQYLSYFRPQDAFDAVRCWLRFRELGDVDTWMEVLAPLMPALDRRARLMLKPDQLYLGQGGIPVH